MYPFLKRTIDIVMSVTAILVLSPFFVLISILIFLDSPGPIFYASERVGRHRKLFNCLKFRTMVREADSLLLSVRHLNQYDFGFVKIENDPRVTKLGALLRKTSLDELPQFFNVLLGHMSIVGNRPLPPYEADLIGSEHDVRFEAEAGITGLWQVLQRGGKRKMSAEKRLEMDVAYAENRTISNDIYLMLMTVPAMWQKSNS